MISKTNIDIRVATSLFVTTIYPNYFWFWIPMIVLFVFYGPGFKFYPEDGFLFAFLIGVFFLTVLGGIFLSNGNNWSLDPFGYSLILFCVLVGRWINTAILKWLLLFITGEAVVCVFEVLLDHPYVFAGQLDAINNSGETEWGSVELLYFNRAYGLSTNSSTAAQKFMFGFMIIAEIPIQRARAIIASICLVAGMYYTFNRTAIISTICFLVLIILKDFSSSLSRKKKFSLNMICFFSAVILFFNWDDVVTQFLRGRSDESIVAGTGRELLFVSGIEFFKSNLVFGNFSQRFEVIDAGVPLHLHNSWLQVMADHGLVGVLIIVHAFSLLRFKNLHFFVTFGLYSFLQYGIFTKLSLINAMFYFFLRHVSSPKNGSSLFPVGRGGLTGGG